MPEDKNREDTPPPQLEVGQPFDGRYIVVNSTNDPIEDVVCIHECAEVSYTNKAASRILQPGEATPTQVLHTRSRWPDLWTISFVRNGHMYVKGGLLYDVPLRSKDCLCIVSLNETTFLITPPHATPLHKTSLLPPFWVQSALTDHKNKLHRHNDEYNGSFIVVNATNNTITDVSVTHRCNDIDDKPFRSPRMGIDEVSTIWVTSHAKWHPDHWFVSFQNEKTGEMKIRVDKRCDYTLDDHPQICIIALYSNSFSIITPVSDPCFFNHY